jgi:hypothetical protein
MAVNECWHGRFFKDLELDDFYEHPLGRTVATTDNAWDTLLTQNTAHSPRPCAIQQKVVVNMTITSEVVKVTSEVVKGYQARAVRSRGSPCWC